MAPCRWDWEFQRPCSSSRSFAPPSPPRFLPGYSPSPWMMAVGGMQAPCFSAPPYWRWDRSCAKGSKKTPTLRSPLLHKLIESMMKWNAPPPNTIGYPTSSFFWPLPWDWCSFPAGASFCTPPWWLLPMKCLPMPMSAPGRENPCCWFWPVY
ncbi:hypothetical protein FEMY_22520 [Ferrovum myxofaciens]|uniref:Uncharacterized protein n=1 Tax=Ferrovum myxofaciens TaxID=416213 RepID=A0A149VVJ1_9PROT|nr:hypothetical protein FEMY_22520 [Ferrovum myxofaciens]